MGKHMQDNLDGKTRGEIKELCRQFNIPTHGAKTPSLIKSLRAKLHAVQASDSLVTSSRSDANGPVRKDLGLDETINTQPEFRQESSAVQHSPTPQTTCAETLLNPGSGRPGEHPAEPASASPWLHSPLSTPPTPTSPPTPSSSTSWELTFSPPPQLDDGQDDKETDYQAAYYLSEGLLPSSSSLTLPASMDEEIASGLVTYEDDKAEISERVSEEEQVAEAQDAVNEPRLEIPRLALHKRRHSLGPRRKLAPKFSITFTPPMPENPVPDSELTESDLYCASPRGVSAKKMRHAPSRNVRSRSPSIQMDKTAELEEDPVGRSLTDESSLGIPRSPSCNSPQPLDLSVQIPGGGVSEGIAFCKHSDQTMAATGEAIAMPVEETDPVIVHAHMLPSSAAPPLARAVEAHLGHGPATAPIQTQHPKPGKNEKSPAALAAQPAVGLFLGSQGLPSSFYIRPNVLEGPSAERRPTDEHLSKVEVPVSQRDLPSAPSLHGSPGASSMPFSVPSSSSPLGFTKPVIDLPLSDSRKPSRSSPESKSPKGWPLMWPQYGKKVPQPESSASPIQKALFPNEQPPSERHGREEKKEAEPREVASCFPVIVKSSGRRSPQLNRSDTPNLSADVSQPGPFRFRRQGPRGIQQPQDSMVKLSPIKEGYVYPGGGPEPSPKKRWGISPFGSFKGAPIPVREGEVEETVREGKVARKGKKRWLPWRRKKKKRASPATSRTESTDSARNDDESSSAAPVELQNEQEDTSSPWHYIFQALEETPGPFSEFNCRPAVPAPWNVGHTDEEGSSLEEEAGVSSPMALFPNEPALAHRDFGEPSSNDKGAQDERGNGIGQTPIRSFQGNDPGSKHVMFSTDAVALDNVPSGNVTKSWEPVGHGGSMWHKQGPAEGHRQGSPHSLTPVTTAIPALEDETRTGELGLCKVSYGREKALRLQEVSGLGESHLARTAFQLDAAQADELSDGEVDDPFGAKREEWTCGEETGEGAARGSGLEDENPGMAQPDYENSKTRPEILMPAHWASQEAEGAQGDGEGPVAGPKSAQNDFESRPRTDWAKDLEGSVSERRAPEARVVAEVTKPLLWKGRIRDKEAVLGDGEVSGGSSVGGLPNVGAVQEETRLCFTEAQQPGGGGKVLGGLETLGASQDRAADLEDMRHAGAWPVIGPATQGCKGRQIDWEAQGQTAPMAGKSASSIKEQLKREKTPINDGQDEKEAAEVKSPLTVVTEEAAGRHSFAAKPVQEDVSRQHPPRTLERAAASQGNAVHLSNHGSEVPASRTWGELDLPLRAPSPPFTVEDADRRMSSPERRGGKFAPYFVRIDDWRDRRESDSSPAAGMAGDEAGSHESLAFMQGTHLESEACLQEDDGLNRGRDSAAADPSPQEGSSVGRSRDPCSASSEVPLPEDAASCLVPSATGGILPEMDAGMDTAFSALSLGSGEHAGLLYRRMPARKESPPLSPQRSIHGDGPKRQSGPGAKSSEPNSRPWLPDLAGLGTLSCHPRYESPMRTRPGAADTDETGGGGSAVQKKTEEIPVVDAAQEPSSPHSPDADAEGDERGFTLMYLSRGKSAEVKVVDMPVSPSSPGMRVVRSLSNGSPVRRPEMPQRRAMTPPRSNGEWSRTRNHGGWSPPPRRPPPWDDQRSAGSSDPEQLARGRSGARRVSIGRAARPPQLSLPEEGRAAGSPPKGRSGRSERLRAADGGRPEEEPRGEQRRPSLQDALSEDATRASSSSSSRSMIRDGSSSDGTLSEPSPHDPKQLSGSWCARKGAEGQAKQALPRPGAATPHSRGQAARGIAAGMLDSQRLNGPPRHEAPDRRSPSPGHACPPKLSPRRVPLQGTPRDPRRAHFDVVESLVHGRASSPLRAAAVGASFNRQNTAAREAAHGKEPTEAAHAAHGGHAHSVSFSERGKSGPRLSGASAGSPNPRGSGTPARSNGGSVAALSAGPLKPSASVGSKGPATKRQSPQRGTNQKTLDLSNWVQSLLKDAMKGAPPSPSSPVPDVAPKGSQSVNPNPRSPPVRRRPSLSPALSGRAARSDDGRGTWARGSTGNVDRSGDNGQASKSLSFEKSSSTPVAAEDSPRSGTGAAEQAPWADGSDQSLQDPMVAIRPQQTSGKALDAEMATGPDSSWDGQSSVEEEKLVEMLTTPPGRDGRLMVANESFSAEEAVVAETATRSFQGGSLPDIGLTKSSWLKSFLGTEGTKESSVDPGFLAVTTHSNLLWEEGTAGTDGEGAMLGQSLAQVAIKRSVAEMSKQEMAGWISAQGELDRDIDSSGSGDGDELTRHLRTIPGARVRELAAMFEGEGPWLSQPGLIDPSGLGTDWLYEAEPPEDCISPKVIKPELPDSVGVSGAALAAAREGKTEDSKQPLEDAWKVGYRGVGRVGKDSADLDDEALDVRRVSSPPLEWKPSQTFGEEPPDWWTKLVRSTGSASQSDELGRHRTQRQRLQYSKSVDLGYDFDCTGEGAEDEDAHGGAEVDAGTKNEDAERERVVEVAQVVSGMKRALRRSASAPKARPVAVRVGKVTVLARKSPRLKKAGTPPKASARSASER